MSGPLTEQVRSSSGNFVRFVVNNFIVSALLILTFEKRVGSPMVLGELDNFEEPLYASVPWSGHVCHLNALTQFRSGIRQMWVANAFC